MTASTMQAHSTPAPSSVAPPPVTASAPSSWRGWLAQRPSVFTLALIVQVLLPGEMGYDKWAGIFSHQWMKFLTFVVILSLAYHAWVGMRDIWMDYIKPVGIRLGLQVFTIVWLMGCVGWAIQVLWRI